MVRRHFIARQLIGRMSEMTLTERQKKYVDIDKLLFAANLNTKLINI